MATIEELQAQIAALSARVDALTVPPNRYYSSRYTGETIDKLLTSISGGAANLDLSNLTDYQKALYNIGGRPNRSLVVNGVFRNPVNQQSKSEYRNPVGNSNIITLDRWIAEGGVNVFYNNGNHLGITRDEGTGNALRQNISEEEAQQLVGKTVTASILTISGDLAFATGVVKPLTEDTIITANVNNIRFGLRFFAEAKSYQIGRFETSGGDIVAVKVEIGNIQTLAYKDSNETWQLFEENNFGETLAQCQRYFISETAENEKPGTVYSSTSGVFTIPVSVQMRTTPVLEELKGYEPKIALSDGSTVLITKEEITVLGVDVSGVRIRVDVTGGKTLKNGPASIRDCNMVLSAEL